MHINDPSALAACLFTLCGTLYIAVSGRRERERQAKHEDEKESERLRREEVRAAQDKVDKDETRLQLDYKRLCEELVWRREEMDRRDKTLAKHRTNADEMFEMMAVSGAMQCLRSYCQSAWDKEAAQAKTQS